MRGVMRIRRWLREWLHLMFIGERWLKTIARFGAYLTALLIALWPLPTPSVEFFIGTSTLTLVDRTVSVGALLSAGFFVLIAIYTAGLAWDRSLSPRIGIGREPIVDIDSRCFRLPIYNLGIGLAEPEVSIIEIFDENEQALDTTGAFELHWTNHPPGVRAKISRDDEKTVNLVYVHRGNLLFEGVNHKRDVLTSSRGLLSDRVFFVVRAKLPEWSVTRRRCFRSALMSRGNCVTACRWKRDHTGGVGATERLPSDGHRGLAVN
jgi:hypothetical protein